MPRLNPRSHLFLYNIVIQNPVVTVLLEEQLRVPLPQHGLHILDLLGLLYLL